MTLLVLLWCTLAGTETRIGTENKWVAIFCMEAFTLHLNQGRGQDLLVPILLAVAVSVPVPFSVNTPLRLDCRSFHSQTRFLVRGASINFRINYFFCEQQYMNTNYNTYLVFRIWTVSLTQWFSAVSSHYSGSPSFPAQQLLQLLPRKRVVP